jgi:uroporphyrin-III C-methyltransferase / precorrin-2 dehydrogenase / sirohydrochlorin ferrochelatase
VRFFPAFLDIQGKPVVVVGGGEAAGQKARLLHKANATVHVVSPAPGRSITDLVARGVVVLHPRDWQEEDFAGVALVVAATGSHETDAAVARAASARGIQVNAVDQPDISTFATPAIVERGDVVIGISTGGASPALARRLRSVIERVLPPGVARVAALAREFRGAVRAFVPEFEVRRKFWDDVFDGPVNAAIEAGDDGRAREHMVSLLNGAPVTATGNVHLVGAGPGDVELLTLKAARLLERADVVVYDRLVSDDVLDLARRDARRVFVGKGGSGASWSQDAINRLLLDEARAERCVVRLKGGDPFLFGRGGEELDYLRANGINVSIVPGITAALGCGAAAGIPLTHRSCVSAVTLVTGRNQQGAPEVNWSALAALEGTLVFYMGVATSGEISRQLQHAGLPASTPAALIENGTLPGQRVLRGTLESFPALVRQHGVQAPALIVIGEVAAERSVARLADEFAVAV